ncbi:homolog to phage PhiH1 repressor protein (plasmid) [Natrialba magadii ATCC 43099]|uniref:Phage PhiH1 repressor protein n=1 Tax=Natrialba magadii (strain ATCC 43099 / DSM 3394 / CCM 3739 / CIP 104546 / IAM 13178 / JCM 8861 / NBRC 102185 / NCIMB 2190 / MS3) TaxID=547559 RepID=D3T277_NATMM|nr:helix-turn-helix domain-containing protein [Natrialba magadii]ADD07686.1 homolog to phage PhiH1 repressor protein [Natrialba magadii ATCC 43099]ELY26495.1 phage PhiH1 repressor protein [Natrialba magadii ATCC 43099]
MRFDDDWMSRADDRILEHLSERGPDTPKEMADSGRVRFSRQHINQRCKKLVIYGLLVHLGNGVYDISPEGEQYLDGELDARDLEAK